MINVLLADDHTLFRKSLILALKKYTDIRVIGDVSDASACLDAVSRTKPDIILLDIDMPDASGIDIAKRITAKSSEEATPSVVMLSMYQDKSHVFDSVRAGAMGYATKDCGIDELVDIIRKVNGGSFMLHPALSSNFISTVKTIPFEVNKELTAKEIHLVECLSHGMSNKQISARLHLSERTVKNHLNLVFRKLGVANRAQAVNEAIKRDIISPS